jgi:elongation factor P
MGLVAGRGLERGRFDLDEALALEMAAHGADDAGARGEARAPVGVAGFGPERGGEAQGRRIRAGGKGKGLFDTIWPLAAKSVWCAPHSRQPRFENTFAAAVFARANSEDKDVRVIASSIRKGNIIEREDGQLCVVLSAESFHPGKGTPTTQIDMRRLSDGVKVTDRFKTTEQVERAFVEDKNYDFLYSDADGHHFMNAETYDQIQVSGDVIGDQAQWLQEGMKVILSIFNETPVGIQLPPRVTLEIVETEPAMKGQTASSSYKPAKLSNGTRVMVPPHISAGTRVVIQTEDGSYVERAKD